jgi:chemotaxis protein CheZ
MAATRVDEGLAARLEEIRRDKGESVAITDVADVVESLMTTMTGDLSADDVHLYKELEGLARYIHAARAEISSINPGEIRSDLLPTAADELDAIVEATEKATNQIMDAAEVLESVSGDVGPDVADRLMDATTRIYEACTFQDITGQRITKVVRTLKQIEGKVDDLVRAFHPADGGSGAVSSTATSRSGVSAEGATPSDADLLNGPQSAEDAMKQDDIDALLADFD